LPADLLLICAEREASFTLGVERCAAFTFAPAEVRDRTL